MDYKKKTIEEKAKRYDEALEVVKRLREVSPSDEGIQRVSEIFPELKESEGERIRGNIIATIHLYYGEPLEDEAKEMIAWLERQGEQKFLDDIAKEVTKDKDAAVSFFKSAGIINENGELADEYKIEQGEQKPTDKVEPKFKVGQTIKKEGFNLGFSIVKIEDGFYYNDMGDYFPFTDQDNWELVR